jgi:hypothetical protein
MKKEEEEDVEMWSDTETERERTHEPQRKIGSFLLLRPPTSRLRLQLCHSLRTVHLPPDAGLRLRVKSSPAESTAGRQCQRRGVYFAAWWSLKAIGRDTSSFTTDLS